MDHNNLIAQQSYPPLTGLSQGLNPSSPADATTKAAALVSNIIGILTAIAFIYFAFQVIITGIAYISSQGDPKNIDLNRKRLTEGVLGLVIVFVAVGVSALLATLLGLGNIFDLNSIFSRLGL